MTLANKLTVGRLGLGLVTFFCLWQRRPAFYAAGLALFLAATITDWVDGYIARSTHSVSPFGAMADPIADKVLVIGALIALLRDPIVQAPAWAVFLIIVRELLMGGLRALAAIQGKIFAADRWGKWSMGVQSGSLIVILALLAAEAYALPFTPSGTARGAALPLIVLCLAVSVASGLGYVYRTRSLLRRTWSVPESKAPR